MIPTSTRVEVKLRTVAPASCSRALLIGDDISPDDKHLIDLITNAYTQGEALPKPGGEPVLQVMTHDGTSMAMILVAIDLAAADRLQALRESAAKVVKFAIDRDIKTLAIQMADSTPALEAVAVGLLLGGFRYEEMKGTASTDPSAKKTAKPLEITLLLEPTPANRTALNRAIIIADAQNLARTIASRPGNVVTPPVLANIAKEIAAEVGLKFKVLDEKEMKRLGMGGILAVGGGSPSSPPRMIVLQHKPAAAAKQPPLLVVGKAITFDTGGISIKPADKMQKMIFDKCGAMAVLGLMVAIAKLKLPVHVVGIMSSAENHVSSSAYRPGDVLKMYNGVTVEVTNTDAEGRLVLADALAWGIETYKPSAVVDLATLTGGVVVALGTTMAGLMSNDDGLVEQITTAAASAGEKIWRLPVGEDQRKMLKSDFADIVNSAGRHASPLTGAAFLTYFIGKGTPWAHLDIAGVADTDKALPLYAVGATGFGVRTLVEWVMSHTAVKKKVESMPPPAGG